MTLPLEVLGAERNHGVRLSKHSERLKPDRSTQSCLCRSTDCAIETQASVQVNNSAWLPISSSTVTLLGNATAYGGIGGGFGTLR